MVMFKRRKVEIPDISPSLKLAPNTEVWEIPQTGELFTTYESYLERRDFYHQRDFTCELTGHSNITFYEAWESETASYRQLKMSFPEPLREPILKRVQFSTIGRLEHLVSATYDAFKQDFFPREHVIAVLEDDSKADGIVREKTYFNERYQNGVRVPATSRYLVTLEADPAKGREAIDVPVECENLYRDRRIFSKLLLKSFLKGALDKESWQGAPWTVKPHLAAEFNIPTEIPQHLQHRTVIAERKNMLAMQKKTEPIDQTTFFNYLASRNRPLEVRPIPGGKSMKHSRFIQQDIGKYMTKNGEPALVPYQITPDGTAIPLDLPPGAAGMVMPGQPLPPGMVPMMPMHGFPPNPFPHPGPPLHYPPKVEVVPTPPPPPIKFPCEDTEVPPRKDTQPRPTLKFFSDDLPNGEAVEDAPHPGLKIASVGTLLEIWDSLNVHSEVFILDSFTVDDFAEAMRFDSTEVDCELLNEVHCAVLKQLVDVQGKVQVSLPEFDPSDSEDENEDDDKEESAEPTPEPEFRRATRSSLRKEEAAALLKQRTPTPEPTEVHQAAAMQGDRQWIDRLKERDFRDGGWQVILVGLLHQVSLMPRKKQLCEKILSILAPTDKDATAETAKVQYFTALDISLRLEILQIITQLAVSSPALRKHLDDMSAEMTELRKKRIEQQRMKKDIMDELNKLIEQRKELAAEIQAKKPEAEKVNGEADVEISELTVATNGVADSREGSEDEAPPVQLRRGPDRKRKREEEAARREKAKKEKASQPKRTKEEIKLEKLIDEIETKKENIIDCEEKVLEYANDLRETDCQRSKCLGRDRFCNRYWWFERNGMPYGGVPHTSTAHYGYASGRLWVQGPDEVDRDGLIDLDKDMDANYVQVFDMTMLERKEAEEGETHLESADHWAYIDKPEKIDQLMGWLDERGLREKALKKELLNWRETIVEYMQKMREHLDSVAAKKLGNADDDDTPQPTRVSTRTKAVVEFDRSEWPCLAWHNSLAVEQFGMPHSEGIKKRRKGVAEKKEVKLSKKDAKLVTRTGASYGRK